MTSNPKPRLSPGRAEREPWLGADYLMVVPCKRSIFLLSSAMMLWSSVMRSSYRSVVRSWTSSCSLMRWDCSHWDRENKTQVPMSWHTYRWVILSFMASNHPNLNVEYAPNKHTPAHWPWIPEDTIAELYKAPGAHLSLFTFLALICSLGKGPSAIAHYPHLLFFLSHRVGRYLCFGIWILSEWI